MYRRQGGGRARRQESPHKRGDVPDVAITVIVIAGISPQAWGCTVCIGAVECPLVNLPTSVGMYRRINFRLNNEKQSPHKRGDVPHRGVPAAPQPSISPQAWGCTADRDAHGNRDANLPTSVGMYRRLTRSIRLTNQSPHKRGDVPHCHSYANVQRRISPQAWGCTARIEAMEAQQKNLPTSVGMYRPHIIGDARAFESPHKRGDVPSLREMWRWTQTISPQAWGCTDLPCS